MSNNQWERRYIPHRRATPPPPNYYVAPRAAEYGLPVHARSPSHAEAGQISRPPSAAGTSRIPGLPHGVPSVTRRPSAQTFYIPATASRVRHQALGNQQPQDHNLILSPTLQATVYPSLEYPSLEYPSLKYARKVRDTLRCEQGSIPFENSEAFPAISVGNRFAALHGNYTFLARLGQGATALVYKAQALNGRTGGRQMYAVKVFVKIKREERRDKKQDLKDREQELKERNWELTVLLFLKKLNVSGYTEIHDWVPTHPTTESPEYDGALVTTLMLCDLSTFLARPWGSFTIMGLMEDIILAYNSIHNVGVVHRDAKPTNILIGWNDSRKRFYAVIGDFGWSYIAGAGEDEGYPRLEEEILPVTSWYRPPEIWAFQARDHRRPRITVEPEENEKMKRWIEQQEDICLTPAEAQKLEMIRHILQTRQKTDYKSEKDEYYRVTSSPAMDAWGVGCIIAEMLRRKPLFGSANTEGILKQIDEFRLDASQLQLSDQINTSIAHVYRESLMRRHLETWYTFCRKHQRFYDSNSLNLAARLVSGLLHNQVEIRMATLKIGCNHAFFVHNKWVEQRAEESQFFLELFIKPTQETALMGLMMRHSFTSEVIKMVVY